MTVSTSTCCGEKVLVFVSKLEELELLLELDELELLLLLELIGAEAVPGAQAATSCAPLFHVTLTTCLLE